MEIVPFADEHLDAAAELLAARHERQRSAFPQLPAELDYRAEIAALLERGATGAMADDAYVLGLPAEPELWGPNIWIEPAGHAAADPEALRDVWAHAAAGWYADGAKAHYVIVPATDEALVGAWFRLGFGGQHAHGLLEIPELDWPAGTREATPEDVEELVGLAPLLSRHQRESPVFSGLPEPTTEEFRSDVLDDFATDGVVNLVYEVDGRIVAVFFVCPIELSSAHTSLARPPGAAFIGFAITHPEARGSGAGVALTDASFAWARARGYDTMVTDWRETNLLSSRFWRKRGFRTTFLRLHRSIL